MYSLNTNSWTTWTGTYDVQWMLCGETTDASVNGAVHWTARKTNTLYGDLQLLIVSFHLADEVLREICLPEYHRANPNSWNYGFTSVIYEKLAFTVDRGDPGSYGQKVWEIWLLEDYDNDESWTKFRTISKVPTCRNMVPLQFLDNGEFVIHDSWNNRLIVFNSKTRQIVGKVMHGSEFEVVNYTQSLVLVKEGIDGSSAEIFDASSEIDNHEDDSRRYLQNTSGYGIGDKTSVKSKEGNDCHLQYLNRPSSKDADMDVVVDKEKEKEVTMALSIMTLYQEVNFQHQGRVEEDEAVVVEEIIIQTQEGTTSLK
ncbi:hypothetical protein RHSIM_Rhsim05G0027100 [Rhododendron simsii]|uniref:F-box associated beta-propeller type 1 domain-containing protein n=1 Tax=Rhododendron simsii TaxID=118357 RepID=A0A834GX21_RHOSS|nr:hypothetical protein RHSIM_Rhsim05G0027100 [Rhododendron simsii]